MVRVVFLALCLFCIWLQSLFVQTSHAVVGDRHVLGYGWVGILLGFGWNVVPIGTAWFLWRVKKDRVGAAIFLLFIPAFAVLVMPQLFMERVVVTPTQLIHRREPPIPALTLTSRSLTLPQPSSFSTRTGCGAIGSCSRTAGPWNSRPIRF